MNEVLIYKGSAGEIYSISDGETCFKKYELFDPITIEKTELEYDSNVVYQDDFVRLRIYIKYVLTTRDTESKFGGTFILAELTRDFRVVRRGRILPTDSLIVLEYCIDLMNKDKEKDDYQYKYLPEKFEYPTLESHKGRLVQIAQELNDR